MCKKESETKMQFYSSLVAAVPNVVLTKAERKEVAATNKKIRKMKMKKECYFTGFVTNDN